MASDFEGRLEPTGPEAEVFDFEPRRRRSDHDTEPDSDGFAEVDDEAVSAEEPDDDEADGPGSPLAGLLRSLSELSGRFDLSGLTGWLGADRIGPEWVAAVERAAEFARSRLHGDYPTDEFGFDPEFTTKVYLPLLRPMVKHWFRVELRGAERLPADGAALLVSNHAGALPLDGMVLQSIIHEEIGRHVRSLGADLIFATPYSHDLARKTGTTLACAEDAERLLAAGELVAVFPEGFKGLGKLYTDRYRLQRFGRGGFVSAAVRAQVPIIPISIVGSEEIYPILAKVPVLSRAFGLPYFPLTPLFPWFGPLGAIPLPSKWIIEIGEAIPTDQIAPAAADDPTVIFNVTDQVRETIQQTLHVLLVRRPGIF